MTILQSPGGWSPKVRVEAVLESINGQERYARKVGGPRKGKP